MMKDVLANEPFAAALDQAPIAVLVSDPNTGKLIFANQAAKAAFGPGALHHLHQIDLSNSTQKKIDWHGRPAQVHYFLNALPDGLPEEMATVLSNIPSGICVYHVEEGHIYPIFHNAAFYQMLGFSDEHILEIEQEMTYFNVHREDLPKLKAKVNDFIHGGTVLEHTCRIYNDQKREYRWFHLVGSKKKQKDGRPFFYIVFNDVDDRMALENELTAANEKMQDIINAIPGGVAIYQVADTFNTVYFSDGVPALTGYTVEEYEELVKQDAINLIYREDTAKVMEKAKEVMQSRGVAETEFRKQHRDGHIVWVHVQVKWIGEQDGFPLLHCVFHNISELKEAQLEMDHLINCIPGGIASYRIEDKRFIPTFFSDGVMSLTGHTREEYDVMVSRDALDLIYEADRDRVLKEALCALKTGEVLDISYRMRHKDGSLVWIHLQGRRMGPVSEHMRFYAVFTGMSAEASLFKSIADETADGIYVIDRENYDLLYVSESEKLFTKYGDGIGQKCYQALHGKTQPCEYCTLKTHPADGVAHEMKIPGDRFYYTRFRETEWNGIPAYVKYIQDVTEEVQTRKEKERMEEYFQTVVRNLPSGVAVVRYQEDGSMTPEFMSESFADMTEMSLADAWTLYGESAISGVHPDDQEKVAKEMREHIQNGKKHWEIVYRLKKGNGDYLWVKNTLSLIRHEGGESRVYCVYHDMTSELAEQEHIRQQYKELLLQHYHTSDPNVLIMGHCNVTQNQIYEIVDHTCSDLLQSFGAVRNDFFTGLASFIVDDAQRQAFLQVYLNVPLTEAFMRQETEKVMSCFVQFPKEERGRYVQVKVNLVETPDSDDITGILVVTDITEQMIAEKILHQLSVTGYDFVVDVDVQRDTFVMLTCNERSCNLPSEKGCHSQWVAHMQETKVVPKDREKYGEALNGQAMLEKLQQHTSYTFTYSMVYDNGDIRTKNLTVSAIDLRLGRVCLTRTDITDSIREQQGLLHMIAYTFELAGFIDVNSRRLTIYTRETVLENLPPHLVDDYEEAIDRFVQHYCVESSQEEARHQFHIQTMVERLAEKPSGYDFLLAYRKGDSERYKQVNVLWGDVNHRTICLVRADVTDMLAAERKAKKELEDALALAKEASQAKSNFLSAMSHDIRTPMNAIMGMTTLADAHIHDPACVKDCLNKISVSSKHLLGLINDVLDMSKIERSKITLNRTRLSIFELKDQLFTIFAPQAQDAQLRFTVTAEPITHPLFYGDALRISQIFINILSNAIKFTPEGGSVSLQIQEVPSSKGARWARYRFTVSDTGIGMPKEFQQHLFEPFSRNRAAARIEGTGLGLSITKGLVDLMEGEIHVQSQVDKGSTFVVELDGEIIEDERQTSREMGEEEQKEPASETMYQGRRFLIAEDNPINAEILCGLLALYHADFVVKPDGEQAVEAFAQAPEGTYDAILMDVQMPKMTGYEATRAIRGLERPDAKVIPIIAMTANAFDQDVRDALEAGMNAHVAKPIDLPVLLATINKWIDDEKN